MNSPNLSIAWLGGLTLLVGAPHERVCARPDAQSTEETAIAIPVTIDWSTRATGTAELPGHQQPAHDDAYPAGHEITQSLAAGRVSVMVHLDSRLAPNSAKRQAVRQFALNVNGVIKYEYGAVLPDVINLRDIPADKIKDLRQMPGVVDVVKDEYHPQVIRLHDSIPVIRGLDGQVAGAGYTADGAGVRVCVVDTGIDSDHLMYSDRIDAAAGFDFYNNDSNPEDDNGHGSHVAGIALGGLGLTIDFGCGAGAQDFQGVAPAATLIGVKVLNSGGGGFDSDIVAGINHCADQSASGAQADVINMSIGTGNFAGNCTHVWAVAANNASANGVVPVAASGNENNSNSMGSPACGVDVIAVGATWKADYPTCEDNVTNWNWGVCIDFAPQTDEVGCFSNESNLLDVTAPGLNIWSASHAPGGSTVTGSSGTSMACPHVVGLVALVLGVDPSLTPAEVRQIIRDGATDMGPAGFDPAYGWGRIDVLDTLALASPSCIVNGDCDDGNECTQDICTAGVCSNPNEASGTNCSDAGTACIVQDTCDGNGACTDNGFVATGTACGDASDTECTNPDTCDGSGTCQDNHETAGTTCGDAGNTLCTDPDSCDGSGACQGNHATNGTACDDLVACTVGDVCDGIGTCAGDPLDTINVTVDLAGAMIDAGPFTRCVTFELWAVGCGGTLPDAVVHQSLIFNGGTATATINVPCDVYGCITARDQLHTLRSTVTPIDAGGFYAADFTNANGSGLAVMNLNDDHYIDIVDFAIFNAEFGLAPPAVSCPDSGTYHADVTGDDVTNNDEFVNLVNNFFMERDDNCCMQPNAAHGTGGPLSSVSVDQLIDMGLGNLTAADLNNDGWLDNEDVNAFAGGARAGRYRH
ncbi:MAG: S8 family peptidase [Planctomycetota bacterium]|jgi:subtilisin family serine protease